ncbi:MAG: hypothetical protein J0I12_15380 [Candidatus Eremiobacteraeota bacterium]|nr:hypothetical protein [Candidatus Eremiobacteraeota bacterium]
MSDHYLTYVQVACVLCLLSVILVLGGSPLLASVPLYLGLAGLVVAVRMFTQSCRS